MVNILGCFLNKYQNINNKKRRRAEKGSGRGQSTSNQFYGALHAHSGDLKFQEIVINFRIRDHFRKFICELWKQQTQVELNPFVFA